MNKFLVSVIGLMAFATLSGAPASAQVYHDGTCDELPSCQVNGYSQTCRNSGGTDGVVYVPGCSVVCPANKSPVCIAGIIHLDCNQSPQVPECRCQ